jgi:hypothetical protein
MGSSVKKRLADGRQPPTRHPPSPVTRALSELPMGGQPGCRLPCRLGKRDHRIARPRAEGAAIAAPLARRRSLDGRPSSNDARTLIDVLAGGRAGISRGRLPAGDRHFDHRKSRLSFL